MERTGLCSFGNYSVSCLPELKYVARVGKDRTSRKRSIRYPNDRNRIVSKRSECHCFLNSEVDLTTST
jgi:hypothetical protein